MAKVIANSQGKVVLANNKALLTPPPSIDFPKYTGHVDTVGLTALGWDSYDIQWLQDHVWWDAEDDAYWAVTEANLAFGPNGATPLTWADRANQRLNPDIRYYPKFDPSPSSSTSWGNLFNGYSYIYAIPTHGWDTQYVTGFSSLFSSCINLHSVGDLSTWDTENVVSFDSMFSNCMQLRYVGDLDEWNTSNVTSMFNTFYNCYMLLSVGNISGWNTSKVTSMQRAFFACYNLRELNLTGWDTSKVTTFDAAFNACYSLVSIGDLSTWNTGSATTFHLMFCTCYALQKVGNLDLWNTEKVTTMEQMFYFNYALQSVGDLSRWDVGAVTTMNQMFYNCNQLRSIGDISNWDTSALTTLRGAFFACYNLRSISCSSLDVSKVTNVSQTFHSCYSLSYLDLSGWDLSLCSDAGTAMSTAPFASCSTLRVVKLGPKFFKGSVTTYYFQGLSSWNRDSVYESLYTNQTLRDSNSTAITVKLNTNVYDFLSAQDISDIATKNITLTRG